MTLRHLCVVLALLLGAAVHGTDAWPHALDSLLHGWRAAGRRLQQSGVTVSGLSVSSAGTSVNAGYSWSLTKRFDDSSTTRTLQVQMNTPTTVNYQVIVTRSISTQTVQVAGTFRVGGNGTFDAAGIVYTFAPPPGGTPSGQTSCTPPNSAPSTCTFTKTWSDNSATAASSGTLTVSLGGSQTSTGYSFTSSGGGGSTGSGACAVVADTFTLGTLSAAQVSVGTSKPPTTGIQVCDSNTYSYPVTFTITDQTVCTLGATVTNTATLSGNGVSVPAQSTTLTLKVAGCTVTGSGTGTGSLTATVGNIKTTVINSYSWTLEKSGGGTGLTTTPDQELSIPFTITATQTQMAATGWVAGTVSVQNTGGSAVSLTGVAVSLGGSSSTPVMTSACGTTTIAASATTSCSFNVSNPAAPAAGSVTATVTYTPASSSTSETATSAATTFDYTGAETFNLGATATLYDTIDTKGLSTITSVTTGVSSLVRLSPADAAPPTSAPGITLSGTKTFSYSVVISRLMQCANSLTVSNTATLTPVGGTQGVQSKSASATFSVTGCDVLPSVGLLNIQTWAAVTYTWSMTKSAQPNSYQLPVGQGGNANYQVQLTRTPSTGNYWLSATLQITNPAKFPLYISSVTLMSTSGQFGALPPMCLGGSNMAGTTASTGVTNTNWGGTNVGTMMSGTSSSFLLAPGLQAQCNFNVSAGSGAAPQGTLYAQATTSSSYVSSLGNTAISQSVPYDFTSATKTWDIGGCVMFSDSATSQGSAGAWAPQLTGLPQQQRICSSTTIPYAGTISPVPTTGAICGQAVTITNTATAMAEAGGTSPTPATATITVTATGCPAPSPALLPPAPPPPVQPSPPLNNALASAGLLGVVIVPGTLNVMAVGGFVWSVNITNAAAGGVVAVPAGAVSAPLVFAVTARRGSGFTYYVSGIIEVSNPTSSPVQANSVVATFPVGDVPAACPSRLPLSLPAGASMRCLFNASLSDPAPGSVSASATSSAGTASSQAPLPYVLAGSEPTDAPGRCADVSDSIARSAQLTSQTLQVAGNHPPGGQAPACNDTSYSFSASFGPFPAGPCTTIPVTATAMATPQDGRQAPATADSSVQLKVGACDGDAQSGAQPGQGYDSVPELSVEAPPPTGRSMSSVVWRAATSAPFNTAVSFNASTTIAFNVTWDKQLAQTSNLVGRLTVTNPTASPVAITSASVAIRFADAAADAAAAAPPLEATCDALAVPPGGSVSCNYSASQLAGGGNGTVAGQVVLASGRTINALATPFELPSSSRTRGGSLADACADVTTGLLLGSVLMLPDRQQPNNATLAKECAGGSRVVSVTLGPFKQDECGTYAIVSTTRVRPLSGMQAPFASTGVAKLAVRDCSLNEEPTPEANIDAEQLQVSNVLRRGWNVTVDSNPSGPLEVSYKTPAQVAVQASITRSAGVRSVALNGTLQLSSTGRKPVTASKVQVAGLERLGELKIVDAVCAGGEGGALTIPARPDKLNCTFKVSGLPPMDGAVVALVYLGDPATSAPLPTVPTIYRTAAGQRVELGRCAVLGTSRALAASDGSSVPDQPASDASVPAAPVCDDTALNYTLTFGPFDATQCGSYAFSQQVSAQPWNASGGAASATLAFNVAVGGCSGSSGGGSGSGSGGGSRAVSTGSGAGGRGRAASDAAPGEGRRRLQAPVQAPAGAQQARSPHSLRQLLGRLRGEPLGPL